MNFISHHIVAILIAYWTLSAAIGALPAPTKDSSPFYGWFFRFANIISANLLRAYSTAIERSPNFNDAVKKLSGGS